MGRRELGVPKRPEHEQPCRLHGGDDMTQESEALTVRPLQVVEHEHGWLERGGGRQKARHRPVEEVALGVGIRPRRCRNHPQALTQRGDHRCDVAAVSLDVGSKHVLGRMCHVMVQRLGEGRVWRADVLLATSEEHAGALLGGAAGGLGDQCRLPDTGVTRHEDHGAAFSGRHSLVGVRQQCRLGLAGDDSGERHVHQACGERHVGSGRNFIERLPMDVEDHDGLREALQLERTESARSDKGCAGRPSPGWHPRPGSGRHRRGHRAGRPLSPGRRSSHWTPSSLLRR